MSEPARDFVLDSDGHVIEPADLWARYVEPRFRSRIPRPTRDENGNFCYVVDDTLLMRTAAALTLPPRGQAEKVRIPSGGWDPEQRLRDMDSEGIDLAVLFPTLSFFFPEIRDRELHGALCRAYNDWLADYCRTDARRLVGVSLLPLDDVDASIRELERSTQELDFRGAFFRPNPYAGRPIQHPCYDPFWDCVGSLGVPVTVHEGISDALPTLGRERSDNPVLQHLMSHPFEQMAACAALILGGVLERFPKLKFVFLESGTGWLPYWLDRMDSHWETWSNLLPGVKMKPSDYFKRQCFIAMDPDDEVAAAVVKQVGEDVMVWSSDYPHPDAPFPGAVKKTLDTLSELPARSRRKVLGENGLRLYGLEPPA